MLSKSLSYSIATLSAALAAGAISSTPAEATIMSGRISGTWQSAWDGLGVGLSAGDAFTTDYTYDSDSIVNYDYSNYGYDTYLLSRAPLLSLIFNSGTVSHTFDFSTSSSYSTPYIQWYDVNYNDTYYGLRSEQGTSIYALDYADPGYNSFYAESYSATDYYGTPYSGSHANFYSSDSTGAYSSAYDYETVAFLSVTPASNPDQNPTSVPEPSMLLGLAGLGLGVLRQRKAQEKGASEA